jgi:hypothetical protein
LWLLSLYLNLFDDSRTVSDLLRRHASFMQDREQEIGMRCELCQLDVSSTFHRTRSPSGEDHRQWRVVMLVTVAHSAAVQNQ